MLTLRRLSLEANQGLLSRFNLLYQWFWFHFQIPVVVSLSEESVQDPQTLPHRSAFYHFPGCDTELFKTN